MNADNLWTIPDDFYTYKQIISQYKFLPNRVIGGYYTITYCSKTHKILSRSEWEPTGLEMYWEDVEEKPWWNFWK